MNYIDQTTPVEILKPFLVKHGWISSDEEILSIEKPGEGNMNVVLRIQTNKRSLILKQSRPFVQKYQEIEAPLDRIAVEHQFYKAVQNDDLSSYLPSIIGYDHNQHILILEDLGLCEDMITLYTSRKISKVTLKHLVSVLEMIHQSNVPNNFPENMEMRKLNHQHIYVLPFLEDNGFQLDDIQDGLQEISKPYKQDVLLKARVQNIGEKYLSKGSTLIHGDYYPGSWMKEGENLFIIDPEFGFSGFAEFDLGVMAAHIIMTTANESYLDSIFDLYQSKADKTLMTQVAGIEIIRRLIGLAQLPIERSITEKQYLLSIARKMIMS